MYVALVRRMFCVRRCARCQAGISANELVMKARDLVFHLSCFTCSSCGVPLSKGDTFGMRDSAIYCRPHYELIFSEAYCEEEIAAMLRYFNLLFLYEYRCRVSTCLELEEL